MRSQLTKIHSLELRTDLDIAFGMTADTETLRAGQCTSCGVKQDKSAYWAPALYFMHENGEAEIVEEVGGMLA